MNLEKDDSLSPYEDPVLLERAGNNRQLLDRLVGLKIAEHVLREDPDNPTAQATYLAMKSEVERVERLQNE